MPTQAVQFVPALSRFGAEFAYGRGGSLPNRAESPFEVETCKTLLVGAELVEKHPVGGVPLCFYALDDSVFDIVERDAIRGRLLPGAAVGAGRSERYVPGGRVNVQARLAFQRRPLAMLLR